jgi:hypothetical protein
VLWPDGWPPWPPSHLRDAVLKRDVHVRELGRVRALLVGTVQDVVHARRLQGLQRTGARKVLGWPKICKLAHAFLWEYSYKRLKLVQLLGQLGVFLTWRPGPRRPQMRPRETHLDK